MAGAAVMESVSVPSATSSTAGMGSSPPLSLAAPGAAGLGASASGVMAELALVLAAAAPGGLAGVSGDQALRVVEAAEAVKAWADSISLDATAVLVTELESDFTYLAPERFTSSGWARFFRQCRCVAAREIQVATGLPVTQCQRRVWLAACEPERAGPVREAMARGHLTLARAMTLAEATRDLDGLTAAAIAARVLAPLTGPDGAPLPGAPPLSEATFRARLHRQLVLHHGLVEQARRTHAEALKARRVCREAQRDGTALLLVSGDGPRIAAAQSRVDTIARRLRAGGDPRTLDQLRADVATDLLIRGWIPNDPTFTALGQPPAAVVHLVVSLPTLLGLDHGVGHLSGWGDLPGPQARELALALGSIWKRVVTDPLTGRAIEVTAGTYRVPAAMAEQVKTRDGTCRAPGCEIPAQTCDLDHTQEWAQPSTTTRNTGGATTETNLAALHRGHHNLKTAGYWDSHQKPDGTVAWTTATGRTMTTYPYIYDHPDNQPVKTSPLEARLGRQVAKIINPDIPLPGHLSAFDEIGWAQALAPTTPPPAQFIWSATHHEDPAPADRKASLSGEPPF